MVLYKDWSTHNYCFCGCIDGVDWFTVNVYIPVLIVLYKDLYTVNVYIHVLIVLYKDWHTVNVYIPVLIVLYKD